MIHQIGVQLTNSYNAGPIYYILLQYYVNNITEQCTLYTIQRTLYTIYKYCILIMHRINIPVKNKYTANDSVTLLNITVLFTLYTVHSVQCTVYNILLSTL